MPNGYAIRNIIITQTDFRHNYETSHIDAQSIEYMSNIPTYIIV